MKAKRIFKKSIAYIIVLAMLAMALPFAFMNVSASDTVPTPDSSDVAGYLTAPTSPDANVAADYADDGVVTTNKTFDFLNQPVVFDQTKVQYVSAKIKMNGNVHYNWAESSGQYAYTGLYTNVGIHLGTVLYGNGTTDNFHISYRRFQGIYISGNDSCNKNSIQTVIGATKNLDELELTIKYDPATYTFSIWENGTYKGDMTLTVDPNATSADAVKAFTFGRVGIAVNGGLGTSAVDPEDPTNGATTANSITVSGVHLWGGVSKVPTIGNNEDLAADLTLSDATLNADWKADGSFAWNPSNGNSIKVNGLDTYFTKGNGTTVYATVTMNRGASQSGPNNTFGAYFTSNKDMFGVRPSWNQMVTDRPVATPVVEKTPIAGDGGLFANSFTFLYVYDVDASTVDVYINSQVHKNFANWMDLRLGDENQWYYVGKYSYSTTTPEFGLYGNPSAEFTGNVNVSNLKVWAVKPNTSNVADKADVFSGGNISGTSDSITATDIVFNKGTTLDTDGVYTPPAAGYRRNDLYVWDGLVADLSKGSITFEADITLYRNTKTEVHSGWIPATVDGHYVIVGLGAHGGMGDHDNNPETADSWGPTQQYSPQTFINKSNLNGAAHTATVLGASATMNTNNVKINASEAGTTAHLKIVLSTDSLVYYVDGKLVQTYDLSGKTVVPMFAWSWSAGNENDNITNVKIYGDGVWSTKENTTNVAPKATVYTDGQFISTIGKGADTLLSDPAILVAGSTVDTDGVYVTSGVGSRARGTIVWKDLNTDLSKGSITIEGDIKLHKSSLQGEVHNGFVPCTVDGEYVVIGLGYHTYNSKSDYFPQTFINASNLNEGAATQTVLGGSATANPNNVKVETTNNEEGVGTTVRLKVVLTATSVTSYVDGTLAQTYDLTGKEVVPQFGFVWSSGNALDQLSNVSIYGDGVWSDKPDVEEEPEEPKLYTYKTGNSYTSAQAVLLKRSEITYLTNALLDDAYKVTAKISIDGFGGVSNHQWTPYLIVGTYEDGGSTKEFSVGLRAAWYAGYVQPAEATPSYVEGKWGPSDVGNKNDTRNWDTSDMLITSNAIKSYNYDITYADGKMTVAVNGIVVVDEFDTTTLTNFKPTIAAFYSCTDDLANVVTNTTFSATVKDATIIEPVVTEEGTVHVAGIDSETSEIMFKVVAKNGYALDISKFYTEKDEVISYICNLASDDDDSLFVARYVEGATVNVGFIEKATTDFSFAVVGTQVHLNALDKVDGIRFLNRILINASESTVQVANGMTVTYNGATYTVTDYGVIASRATELGNNELTLDNYYLKGEDGEFKASGINDYIYAYTSTSVDMTCVIMSSDLTADFYDCEYVVRGYIELTPENGGESIVIYSNQYVETVRNAAAKAGITVQ